MGQEIERRRLTPTDFDDFRRNLEADTELLRSWFQEGRFVTSGARGGFELEAWLVTEEGRPLAVNERFLALTDPHFASNELSRFNVELNGNPQDLLGPGLHWMEQELTGTWDACNRVAANVGARLVMVGILPSVAQEDLTLANISPMKRYLALNDQIIALRHGRPIEVSIEGRDGPFHVTHHNVMLESAATSFQIHLQVSVTDAHRLFNAAQIISAPMVAISANSPYLFGRDLWAETRIPLFEQSVDSRDPRSSGNQPPCRVFFGSGYVSRSLMECFDENLHDFPVLLPIRPAHDPDRLPHLRLHNGTIWRWNRPLIGYDRQGQPHLRIEHRVVPSGPTVPDMIANAALFYGLVRYYGSADDPPEDRLPFQACRTNLYDAARRGLDAEVEWFDGQRIPIKELLLRQLLPSARSGLGALGVDRDMIDRCIGVLENRAESGQTGSAWQRRWVDLHGSDMALLTRAYRERQQAALPVHQWSV